MHDSLLHLLLKNGDFLNTDISQGSVVTRLGCGGVFVYDFVTNFLLSLNSERILKIGQYLVKLWARVSCLVFLTHGVVLAMFVYGLVFMSSACNIVVFVRRAYSLTLKPRFPLGFLPEIVWEASLWG